VGGICDTHGGGEKCFQGFDWEARRRRWEDNIQMDLTERGIDGTNCIWLAQDRVLG
jgi:hypothetical protein